MPSTLSKPLNTYYETFSNSLTKVSSESIIPIPKVVVPKVNVVTSPSKTNAALAQGTGTTIVALKSAIQNLKPISTTTVQKPEGNTIVVGNKQYQLVRRSPNKTNGVQLRQVGQNSSNNIVLPNLTNNLVVRAQVRPTLDTSVRVCNFFRINYVY